MGEKYSHNLCLMSWENKIKCRRLGGLPAFRALCALCTGMPIYQREGKGVLAQAVAKQ